MISNIESQTVIKERVRITPEKLTAQKKDTLIEKYSKNKRGYSVTSQEEYTTKLIMPYEGYAIVTVIGSEAAGSHTLILRSPIEMEIVDKPEVKIGYRWKSPRFREGEELDFGLWFKGVEGVPAGWEGGAIRYETGIDTYEFWYDNSMFDGDYDDIVIEVRICSNEKWVGVNIRDTLKVVPIEPIRIRAWIEVCDIEEIEGIKYRAEIIKGKEYGEIEEANGGQRGDILEEIIPEWNNEIELMLNFENKNITEEKEIVIKISTIDEGVIPAYIVIKIIPSSIIVMVEPKEIRPGEEANIILKKRDREGTINEFSPEQLFDIKIKEGSEYGTLWIEDLGDTTDEAYYVRAGGLKFKSREDIEENEVEVIIGVNTSPEIMAGNIKEGKGEENRIILRKISNIKEETEDKPLWGIGKVVIKKKDCSSAPQCVGEVEPPWIELKKIESYLELCNKKENLRGAFSPQIEKEFSINQIEACYNKEEDRWQFKLPEGNKFYIEYKLEICYENINRLYGNKAIYSLEELNKIPKDSVCKAIKDFKLLLGSYGEVPKGRYYIVEYTKEHEDVHLSDFRTIVNNTYIKDNFFEKFLNLKLSCEDVKDINDAKMKGKNLYNNLFKEFKKNIKNDWDKKIGQKDSPERTSYENNIHNKIKRMIVYKYVNNLMMMHPEIICN